MDIKYDNAIKELEAEVNRLHSRMEGLRFAIETLRSHSNGTYIKAPITHTANGVNKVNLFNEVDSTTIPAERTELVFNAVASLGIYSKIKVIVAYLNNKFDTHQVRLSLLNLYKDQRVDKIQPTTSNEDTFYGLLAWKVGNIIKPEHIYDRKELKGSTMK